MADLAVIVPTLGRADALEPLARAFEEASPEHRMLFVCDPDDRASIAAARGEALVCGGSYAQKVNAGLRHTSEPYCLIAADDVHPHPGWFEAAVAQMSDTVGFVSVNDLGNPAVMAGEYATFALIARWYAELDDEPYFEGFQHGCCDVDASLRAKARGAFAYAPEAVVEHRHPDWGKASVDATYRRGGMNAAKRRADHKLLSERWPSR